MKLHVLDHGYVEFIEAWGHGRDGRNNKMDNGWAMVDDYEAGIIEAARQSTQGAFRGWEKDKRLLTYLIANNHATPFEFAGMVIEVQAPLFVFREWHRHRTQSYNEMSARYEPLPDLYYKPDVGNIHERGNTATKNMQASGVGGLTVGNAELFHDRLHNFYQIAEAHYKNALEDGVPKELARLVMPVGHYSRMRASANLRNWMAFLTLRLDPKAQWEIRQFAGAVSEIIRQTFPHTWELWGKQE